MAAHNPALAPTDFDWAALGAGVAGAFRTTKGVSCMLGPLEAQVHFWVVACLLATYLLAAQLSHMHGMHMIQRFRVTHPACMCVCVSVWCCVGQGAQAHCASAQTGGG